MKEITGKCCLQVAGASFAYGKKEIFKQVELTVKENELCCLMGHNGCGKSTLLDCILGVQQIDEGQILLEGQDVYAYKPLQLAQRLSYVPQVHDRSFPYTVGQIILMGRTAYVGGLGAPTSDDKEIVRQVMDSIGLLPLANRSYTQISGGEMQMVILARALVQQTPLIVMDEPTSHLDFYNELLFLETLVNLLKKGGKSIIMATHAPNQAFYLENQGINVRVAVMNQGRIAAEGLPRDVLTTDNMRQLYHIESAIVSDSDCQRDLSQIVPLRTLEK